MNTEESSPPLKPFDEQTLPPPDLSFGGPVAPVPAEAGVLVRPEAWWAPWINVLIAGSLWFGSVIVLAVLPLIVTIPYVIYKIVAGGGITQESLLQDPWLIFFTIVAVLPAHAVTLLIGWWYVTGGGKRPFWKTLEFEWPENVGSGMGLMLSVLLALVLFALAVLITSLWGGAKTDLDLLIERSMPGRFALAFAAVATAPLVEEVIYRGILYGALERAAGKIISVIAVSLLFAGVHVVQYRNNIAVILVITLLSFTLTTSRALTGKLLPAFIIHLVFNGIQSVLIVLGAFVDHELLK